MLINNNCESSLIKIFLKTIVMWILSICPRPLSRWILIKLQNKHAALNEQRFIVAEKFFQFSFAHLDLKSEPHFLEFGGGKDCVGAIVCASTLKSCSITSVDIEAQLDHNQFIAAKNFYTNLRGGIDNDNIRYLAPIDLSLQWPNDIKPHVVFSINTMEHIPASQLIKLTDSIYNKLPEGGYFINLIDYSDHFSNITSAITEYNFYRFNSLLWKFFNPPLHHQNRLRHNDFISIFEDLGFKIISEKRLFPVDANKELEETPIRKDFKDYKKLDLLTTAGYIIARKI